MEKHGVIVGYLFGSAARGTMGPHSDIDTAVFFDEIKVPRERQFDARLALMGDIASACGVETADVINLNEVQNPVIRYEAVVKGIPILIQDNDARVRLAVSVLREFEGTRHLRKVSYRILREHAKSGAFGRAPVTANKHVAV